MAFPKLALAGVLLAATSLSGCGNDAKATVEKEGPKVSVLTPGRQELSLTVSITGSIHARDETPIGVEGEGARISQVYVEAGDRVKRGQLLVRLDPSVGAPQVGSLSAAYEEAIASAELARSEAERAVAVAASGALPKQEIDRRVAAARQAEARVKVAGAQLAESRARFARTEIRAPADGIVLTRNAEVGQIASPGGEPLFRLGRGGAIEMRGRVAEQDVPKLAIGQKVSVFVSGLDRPFEGTVRLIGAVIDAQSRLGSVRIDLAPDPNLRPGAFARAEVIVAKERWPVLPQTALLADERGQYVFIIGPDNKVVRRPVRIGDTRNEGLIVTEGLDGTERVVTVAGAFLREGERVWPLAEARDAAAAPEGARS